MTWRNQPARRATAAAGVLAASLLIGMVPATAAAPPSAPPPSAPLLSAPAIPGGVGARVPFIEHEAEDAEVHGTVIGPDRAYGTLAAEAIGRQAVQLDAQGEYVEFTLTKAANALNLRYSIPDSADGAGLDATLGVYVDGQRIQSLALTSRYSWYYGQFPWTNDPADGGRRHMYDDSRVLLGETYPAGTAVRLQVGEQDVAPWYVVDVVDFEKVAAPTKMPRGAESVVAYGADPTGVNDSSDAIQAALDAASGTRRTVWLPEGTFLVTRHLLVDRVTLRGAGQWRSTLTGDGVGVFGREATEGGSSDVHLSDFAIFGEVRERNDTDPKNAIGGCLSRSTVDKVWMQHTKVGIWVTGPMDDFTVSRSRILDQTADGINFVTGVTNSSVTDTYVRTTGDDGLAMWSLGQINADNTYTRNTVKAPTLANNIAIYGGRDITVSRNLVTDTLTQGGGIQIANRFGAQAHEGTTTVSRNHLLRTGSLDLFTHIGNGALWFWAGDSPLTATLDVRGNIIEDSSYSAIQLFDQPVTGAVFNDTNILGAGTFAVQLNASGSASFRKTAAAALGASGVYDCASGFSVVDAGKNTGWADSTCGFPAPGPLEVTSLGETVAFATEGDVALSDPQVVTITNPTTGPVRLASVSITGSFALDHTCGDELAPGASCVATIAFAPTPRGERVGALTISDGTPAGRYQVYVRGEVLNSLDGNLAASRPVVTSGEVAGCCGGANAVDGSTATYWESTNDAFPQTLAVDLGRPSDLARVVLQVTPGWGARTQVVEIRTSTDGQTWTTAAPATEHVFDPAVDDNRVTVLLPGASQQQHVQILVTANSGWLAAQVAEMEVYSF